MNNWDLTGGYLLKLLIRNLNRSQRGLRHPT